MSYLTASHGREIAKLYTIGFTRKSAEAFFELLRTNGVQRLEDIRLHHNSQLAGFAKQTDLTYFLRQLVDCEYRYMGELAPTEGLLSEYRSDHNWTKYAKQFERLMDERNIPASLNRSFFEGRTCCLLCSEPAPDKCHRRLVAERLVENWSNVEIVHLT